MFLFKDENVIEEYCLKINCFFNRFLTQFLKSSEFKFTNFSVKHKDIKKHKP